MKMSETEKAYLEEDLYNLEAELIYLTTERHRLSIRQYGIENQIEDIKAKLNSRR